MDNEKIWKYIKELNMQQKLLVDQNYSYQLVPKDVTEGVFLEQGKITAAYCLSAYNYFIKNAQDFETALKSGGHHPLTGPFRVKNFTNASEILVCIHKIVPFYDRVWSITKSAGVLHKEFGSVLQTAGDRFFKIFSPYEVLTANPMVGFIGTEPKNQAMSSGRGGVHGGNLDLPCIKEGSMVILPVTSERPGIWFGDLHLAQGSGELAGVAVECSGSLSFSLTPVTLTQKTQEPIVIEPLVSGGYNLYFVGCRNNFNNALKAAVKNAMRYYPELGAHGYIEGYRNMGIYGNIVMGQAVGKTVSLAVQMQIESVHKLFANSSWIIKE